MIESANIPPQVKPIFQRFIAAIAKLKPCVDQANLQCIWDAFENMGVKVIEQGVRLSQGPLQFLFQRMLAMDRVAVANFHALPKNAGQQGVAIADYVFNDKAERIQQYLQQFQ